MNERHPQVWILGLLHELSEDPVISLERRDPPTHAVVRTIYAGIGDEAIVEVELIDSPPPPSTPVFGGSFEAHAYEAPGDTTERPWFVFDRHVGTALNVARLQEAARDHVLLTGRRGSMPACVDAILDPEQPSVAPRAGFDDLERTQRVPSNPPPSRPPSSRSPKSIQVRAGSRAPAPPRRRKAPPEPPPPAPPIGPPSSQRQPRHVSSIPPAAMRPPSGPIPPPPPVPASTRAAPPPPASTMPASGRAATGSASTLPAASALPPPPPPPPPPPFGEEEL